MKDDDFKPKLGRGRAPRERSYVQRVLHSTAKAGGRLGKHNRRFNGSRIGRGSGAATRAQFAGPIFGLQIAQGDRAGADLEVGR